MAVRLLFPTAVFERDLLDPKWDKRRGVTKEYLNLVKEEMDAMRRRDPQGRKISNEYSGWQSNDGCESSPIMSQLMRKIEQLFKDEVLPYHGCNQNQMHMEVGNSWANINDFTAWNRPHLHNGCWYSGVFYVKADGDEGDLSMIDTNVQVVSDFPHSPRSRCSFNIRPTTGLLVLFPSGLMHMVDPNLTQKDRYSISFNMNTHYHSPVGQNCEIENYNPDEYLFEIDKNGNPTID